MLFNLSKKQDKCFYKNFHNSRMVGCGKLPDPSLNSIFNAVSIDIHYTLSFQWTNFDLNSLLPTRQASRRVKPCRNDYNLIWILVTVITG